MSIDHRGAAQVPMALSEAARELAERFAPILMLWPEIPADANASDSLRSVYAHDRQRTASRATSGAHITRDFHPRSVRLILDHSQAWELRPPLPLMPLGFVRIYRDFARFFFLPIMGFVVIALLAVAMAQGLADTPRMSIDVGALAFLGALYLLTLRSPILTPVDNWHYLNHAVSSAGLVVAWLATFGTGALWYIALIVAVPSIALVVTSLILRAFGGFAGFVLAPIRWLRSLAYWILNRHTHPLPERSTGGLRGLKAAHEYSEDAELFFRHPRDGKPLHRSERSLFWSAYSRIIARNPDRYPMLCYARVLEPVDGVRAVQYWFNYYYDDWANEHEADWEMVMVLLRGNTPIAVASAAHESGELRDWRHVERRGDHPILYVGAGSHAMFFNQGAYVAERAVAGLRFTSIDAAVFGREVLDFVDFTAGRDERVECGPIPVVVIPDPDYVTGLWGHVDHGADCQGDCDQNFEWLNYDGHWGSVGVALTGGFSGPRGPAASGLPWSNPYLWAKTVCRPCPACEEDQADVRRSVFSLD